MKSPTDREHKLRLTELLATSRGTCNTTQGESGRAVEVCGCPTTLPKPSHMLLTRTTYRRDAVPRGQVRYPRHGSRWRFIRSRSTSRPAMQSVVSGMPASLAEHLVIRRFSAQQTDVGGFSRTPRPKPAN